MELYVSTLSLSQWDGLMIMSEQYLFPLTCYIQGTRPGTRTCEEREDISAFSDLKKDPFSRISRLKNTPIFMKMLAF